MLLVEEQHSKSGKNPRRVGADFHRNLKRLGLLNKDDEDWLANVTINYCYRVSPIIVVNLLENNIVLRYTVLIIVLHVHVHVTINVVRKW